MKRIFNVVMVCVVLMIGMSKATAQELVNQPGLHLDVEAGYSPISSWGTELIETDNANLTCGKLSTKYTVGTKMALVYQLNNEFYFGGGLGLRMVELEWKPLNDGGGVIDSYALPLFVRGGICENVAKNLSFFLNADCGVTLGVKRQNTCFGFSGQVGIYYGTTKIALGLMPTKPESEYFFGEDFNKGYEVAYALILGLRL